MPIGAWIVGGSRSQARWRRAWPSLFFVATVPFVACTGLELRPEQPPRAEPSPLSPTSIVVQDSLLSTVISVDLTPMLEAVKASMDEAVDAALSEHGVDRATDDVEQAVFPAAEAGEAGDAGTASADARPRWVEADDGKRMRARVWQDGIRAELHDDTLRVSVRLLFTAALAVDRGRREQLYACGCDGKAWCGGAAQPPRRVVAHWSVPLAVAKDWTLEGKPTYELETVDRCPLPRVDGQVFDVSERLFGPLAARGEKTLRNTLASFDGIQRVAQPLWQGLAVPAPLGKEEGPGLLLRPRAMRTDQFDVHGTWAKFPVRIAMSPIVATVAPEVESVGWPPPSSVEHATGFRVASELRVPVEKLEQQLTKVFVGRRYPNRSTRYVEVTSVNVYGSDSQAVVRLGLDGTGQGEIFLVGKPAVDGENEELRLEDVQLTPQSLTALRRLYDEVERADLRVDRTLWIDPQALVEEVASESHWSLRKPLMSLKRQTLTAARRSIVPNHDMWLAIKDSTIVAAAIDGVAARVLVTMSGRAGFDRAPVSKTPESAQSD